MYTITAVKLDQVAEYSNYLYKHNIPYRVSADRITSHTIHYIFWFEVSKETFNTILKDLNIKGGRI